MDKNKIIPKLDLAPPSQQIIEEKRYPTENHETDYGEPDVLYTENIPFDEKNAAIISLEQIDNNILPIDSC